MKRYVRGLALVEALLGLLLLTTSVAFLVTAGSLLASHQRRTERDRTMVGIRGALEEHLQKRGNYPESFGAPNPSVGSPGVPGPWDTNGAGWRQLNYAPEGEVEFRYQVWTWTDGYLISATGDDDRNGIPSYYWEVWSGGKRVYAGDLRPGA